VRVVLPLLLLAAAAAADRDPFRPLKVPASLAEDVEPKLPPGIVTEAAPFDALVRELLKPYERDFEERRAAIAGLDAARLKAAFGAMAKENADWRKRVARVEALYAEVYNRGWMEASEKERNTRKATAVLVPFYRTLLLRNRAVAEAASPGADALASPDEELRRAAARALGRAGGEAAPLLKTAKNDPSPRVRAEALAALLRWKVSEMKAAPVAALLDEAWEVRALAIAILVRARLVEAVPALVQALAAEKGRLRKDIDDALFALTGVRMYGDPALWRDWLSANGETVARKARELAEAGEYDRAVGPLEAWEGDGAGEEGDEAKRKGHTSAFYGIPTQSRRVMLVVDISLSMEEPAGAKPATTGDKNPYAAPKGGTKLDIAKWQLHRAIHDLPDDAVFGIIVYSESYASWEQELVAANARGKKKAHAFVDGINANGTTNISDSLDRALDSGADTIFLLSDGDPNRGRLSGLDALLAELVERNRLLRVVIHTIGIGEVEGSAFLRELARRTGGRYVGFR
jgi:hypothetical protein